MDRNFYHFKVRYWADGNENPSNSEGFMIADNYNQVAEILKSVYCTDDEENLISLTITFVDNLCGTCPIVDMSTIQKAIKGVN